MPVYCETWLHGPGALPVEPVNTATSFVAVILGILALFQLMRFAERGIAPYVLACLLFLTGLGSVAWHALRDHVALTADTMPGLLYFGVLVFFWIRYLGGRWFGVLPLAVVAVLVVFLGPVSLNILFIVLGIFVVILAGSLLTLTFSRRRQTFNLALATVGFAAIGLGFRSIDLYMCDFISVGTHFLWHIFLAAAAFSGVHMIMALKRASEGCSASNST